jgi:hypothetical protein
VIRENRRVVASARRLPVPPGPLVAGGVVVLLAGLAAAGAGRGPSAPQTLDRPTAPRAFSERNVGFGTLVRLPEGPWVSRYAGERDTRPFRASVSSGPAVATIWIYARGRRGPRTTAQLRQARKRLVAAARTRDASFRVLASGVRRYDRLPAIELRGTETILGRPRTVRSVHLFVGGREIVVDAYAPAEDFKAADVAVFRPLLQSLRIAPDWRRLRALDRSAAA